jgi:tetratricopeptide (TPR) repeat protein
MNPIFLFFILFVAACHSPVEDPLQKASGMLPLIRGDDYWQSQAQRAVAHELFRQDQSERAEELILQIQGYRRALARLDGVEVLIQKGKFEDAGRLLLSYGSLPLEGVAQQSWEIMGRMFALGEAAGCGPETLAAVEKAGIVVPPMFKNHSKGSFMTAGAKEFNIDSTGSEDRKGKGKKTKSAERQKENSPGNGTSKEAPEGGEKLQGRMKVASGGLAILDRTEGFIAQGKLNEAKDTIRQSLSEGVEFRMSNVGMRADCLRLAYHAGFQDEVAKSIDDLLKITRSQPKALDTAYLYWGKVVRLLGVLGRVDEANTMTAEGAERISTGLPDFFQMQAYAELGTGVYQAGLEKEARKLWNDALIVAEKIENPRSRAWGVFQVLLGQARAGAPTTSEEEEKINKIKKILPEAYARIGQ